MIVQTEVSLKPYNTFGINVLARYMANAATIDDLKELLSDSKFVSSNKMVLGGGSNVLFTGDYQGLVIRNNLKGIEKVKEDENYVWIKAAAGEVWHQLVLYCIEHNFGGIENLSLIPGSVGAGPMQNIGAYGVELKDTFFELEALHISSLQLQTFSNPDCRFGYRQSIFKSSHKNQYIITSVTLQLTKKHKYNISYGAIETELARMGVTELNLRNISNAVINIRSSKLPDPAVIGNAGSFFKNPEISRQLYNQLKEQFNNIPGYELDNGNIKLAAGWLIEQCGWKGKVIGQTGSHKNQALVLVNYGGATGAEVLKLARDIQKSVKEKFNVELEMEVNIV